MLLNLKTVKNYYLYDYEKKLLFASNYTIFTIYNYLKINNICVHSLSSKDIIRLSKIFNISENKLISGINRIVYLEHIGKECSKVPAKNVKIDEESIKWSVANVKQIGIEITEKCNLDCYYCCYGKLYNNIGIRSRNIDIENCKSILSSLVQLLKSEYNLSAKKSIAISFYGGEPLLNFEGIRQIVTFMKQFVSNSFNIQYYMTTNGILLKDVTFFVENNFRIAISLDGDDNNNSFRLYANGKSTFRQTYENIIRIKDKYPKYYSENINFLSVLHSRNDYLSIYKFFNKLEKIPRISTLATEGVNQSKKIEFEKIYKNSKISNKELFKLKNCLPDVFDEVNNKYENANSLVFSLNQKWGIWDWDSNKQTSTCFLFQLKIFLTVSGLIYPCEKVDRRFPFGTFKNGKIEYYVEKIKSYYQVFSKKRQITCSNCFGKNNCSQCYFMTPDLDLKKCYVGEDDYSIKISNAIENHERLITEY